MRYNFLGEGGKVIGCCFQYSGERPGRVLVLMGPAHMEIDSLQMSLQLGGIGGVACLGRRLVQGGRLIQ